jgi:hypothetical protein
MRLRAPHADTTAGVTIGGQSFGTTTSTGSLAGAPQSFVPRSVQGSFVVRLPPATATLVVVGQPS